MDDVELVNAFFCGGPACEKLYIDRPFYRWEGTGFEQCDPVRDLCEACFTAYTETDKEDFKLYTRDKSKELMKWCDMRRSFCPFRTAILYLWTAS